MTPFLHTLVTDAAAVVRGCCEVRGLPPLEVRGDLKLPVLWRAIEEVGGEVQVLVNPQRLRYVSAFVREYELAAWTHELLARSCAAPQSLPQPHDSLRE